LFEIPLVDPLTLTIILSLFNPYINITFKALFNFFSIIIYFFICSLYS
jgi:hypothetical protein